MTAQKKLKPPCRLQILLSREAPIGVIFRRGPTRWVQLIQWQTAKDEFKPGQWFRGHIYPGRSDLSPDGSLMIYFANKFSHRIVVRNEFAYAWTAVSKPPYLTALALWPRKDCWHGGGLFTGPHSVLLNHKPEEAHPHHAHLPTGLKVTSNPDAWGEDDPITIPRMERDGWKFLQWLEYDYYGRRTQKPCIFEKRHVSGKYKLRVEEYYDPEVQWLCSIIDAKGQSKFVGVGIWADFDQQGRIVFATDGRIFSGTISKNGEVLLTELADFNSATPEPLESPRWARNW
jgi:hypothetical protein